jgi:two-component system KDP operon response regulator KdpE
MTRTEELTSAMTADETSVLVVDDELSIRRFLRLSLSAHHYTVHEAANGEDALAQVTLHRPDLIILDLGLPDLSGLEVTRRLREWSQVPILILSVRGAEEDKIAALDAGADDYVTKPFGIGELLARMRVAIRRAHSGTPGPIFTAGELTVDLARRAVTRGGAAVHLTPIEYDLLRVLVNHAGRVITHRQLFDQVWGAGEAHDAHLLRVNISNLRRKIETNPSRPQHLLTEPGVGYRLLVPD